MKYWKAIKRAVWWGCVVLIALAILGFLGAPSFFGVVIITASVITTIKVYAILTAILVFLANVLRKNDAERDCG